MASNVTSVYSVGVRLGVDSTDFATGTAQAETALTDLATTAQTTASDIDTSLATDVPASVDDSAFSLTTKASKFKAVGTELGQNLAGGIAGGASAPEAIASTGSSLTGLLAASADTAKGALGLVGLGIGVAVVTNILKGVQQRREAVIQEFNSMFGAIEVNAKQSMGDIKQAVFDAFDFNKIVTELGEGDLQAGLDRIQHLVEQTGFSAGEITEALQKGWTPGTKDVLSVLRDIVKEHETIFGFHGQEAKAVDDEADDADRLLELARGNKAEQDKILAGKKLELQFTRETASQTERTANAAERVKAAIEDANAASQALATGLKNAAYQAGIIGDTQ